MNKGPMTKLAVAARKLRQAVNGSRPVVLTLDDAKALVELLDEHNRRKNLENTLRWRVTPSRAGEREESLLATQTKVGRPPRRGEEDLIQKGELNACLFICLYYT